MTFRHSITVRYGECDMQGVVFNAHYLAYADEAVAQWFRSRGISFDTFDFMVKKAVVTWSGGSTFGDVIDFDCSVTRWGRSSFDVTVSGAVRGGQRVEIVLVYVSVTPGTHSPCAVPDVVRSVLET
jgi:acyl-CoA thioester hydrolase